MVSPGRLRGGQRAGRQLCDLPTGRQAGRQAALSQVVRFLPMEREEVSIGPGSTGHEPGRTALVF